MMKYALILATCVVPATTWAGVVINEIFYNAPEDLEDLQWVELYNDGDAPVDLSGWKLDEGSVFVFPAATTMGAHEYVVTALNPARFTESYGGRAMGPLKRPLKRGGERIELADAAGRRIDVARYKDADPWPISPDGYTASLERICPSAPGDVPENWAASPLSTVDAKPNGTPGRKNAGHASTMPPIIKIVSGTPDDLGPEQPLRLEAEVQGEGLREVTLLYRVVDAGVEGPDTGLPMIQDAVTGRFQATIPGQKSGVLVRYRIQAIAANGARRLCPAEQDLRPTFSAYVHDKWESARVPLGLILRGGPDRPNASSSEPPRQGFQRRFGRGPAPNFGGFGPRAPAQPRPPRGASAFVHVDPSTGKTTLFDHIHIVARNNDRGFKLLFHKDRSWGGMKSINMVFEGSEWSLLAEALAFDLYRRAGNPAPLTEFVRLWVDGRMVGYHLAIERINKSFLSRNQVNKDGNLYKIQWTGRDIAGQHEKRTHTQQGHEDVVSIAEKLETTSGEEQWKVIQENFNVEEVATYFAVNMVLSHWDGFFNNYFPYHDTENGKWEMYPWDQDKTWGYYDGLPDDQVFFDMPLTYGMAGDRPPGVSGGGERGGRLGRGRPMWWREGGHFSRPLLANPEFRKVFLDRTREILETIYTEETYFPLIEEMAERLQEDVRLRAEASGRTAEEGTQELTRNVDLLKTHLTRRRQFLLDQQELRGTQIARPQESREESEVPLTVRPGPPPTIVIPAGSRWKYLDTGTLPGAGWTTLEFKEDAWTEGVAQLGYGDGDEATRINDVPDNYPTYYFRQRFEVKDPSKLKPLVVRLMRDDGAVVYINGREVLRDNMPEGSIDRDTYAVDSMTAENEFYVHELAPERLVAGSNIIAVEVHQANADSSDVSFDLELREKVPGLDVLGAPPEERRSAFGRGRGGELERGDAGQRSGAASGASSLGPLPEREPRAGGAVR